MKRYFILSLVLLGLTACGVGEYSLIVENPSTVARDAEIIEIEVEGAADLIVLNAAGEQIPSQLTYQGNLIFPVTIAASASQTYTLTKGERAPVETIATGRIYTERLDDIGWENDKIGFRMYSEAAFADGSAFNGYDVFTKRTAAPVLDHLYSVQFDPEYRALRNKFSAEKSKQGPILTNAISFHLDHGLGMDYYAVGPTLGCGTMALLDDEGMHYPTCYTSFEVLDEGGLRFTFKVGYDPVEIGGETITESRIITLDAGSAFNKVAVSYENLSRPTAVVAALSLRDSGEVSAQGANYVAYAEPMHDYGWQTYTGVIFPQPVQTQHRLFDKAERKAHGGACGYMQAVSTYTPGTAIEYYCGAGWNRWGFPTPESWFEFMEAQAAAKLTPLTSRLK